MMKEKDYDQRHNKDMYDLYSSFFTQISDKKTRTRKIWTRKHLRKNIISGSFIWISNIMNY